MSNINQYTTIKDEAITVLELINKIIMAIEQAGYPPVVVDGLKNIIKLETQDIVGSDSCEKGNYWSKDDIFCDYFSKPENTLELYRVLHPEDTDVTIDDLTILTLKRVVTNGLYNDLGFQVKDKLVILVEVQSTWSVNIVFRSLIYLMRTYYEYQVKQKLNVYSSTKIKIPKPELYVIYTGDKDTHPNVISFKDTYFPEGCCVDAVVKVLYMDGSHSIIDQYINVCKIINSQVAIYGRTRRAMKEAINICKDRDYMKKYLIDREVEVIDMMTRLYDQEIATIAYVEEERRNGIIEGRREGMREGMREGRREGEEKVSKLYAFLQKGGRTDDMVKAFSDVAFRNSLMEEYASVL